PAGRAGRGWPGAEPGRGRSSSPHAQLEVHDHSDLEPQGTAYGVLDRHQVAPVLREERGGELDLVDPYDHGDLAPVLDPLRGDLDGGGGLLRDLPEAERRRPPPLDEGPGQGEVEGLHLLSMALGRAAPAVPRRRCTPPRPPGPAARVRRAHACAVEPRCRAGSGPRSRRTPRPRAPRRARAPAGRRSRAGPTPVARQPRRRRPATGRCAARRGRCVRWRVRSPIAPVAHPLIPSRITPITTSTTASTTPAPALGSGSRRRMARSASAQRTQAIAAASTPRPTRVSARTRSTASASDRSTTSSATPAARSASAVRIQARKVRSLAKLKR